MKRPVLLVGEYCMLTLTWLLMGDSCRPPPPTIARYDWHWLDLSSLLRLLSPFLERFLTGWISKRLSWLALPLLHDSLPKTFSYLLLLLLLFEFVDSPRIFVSLTAYMKLSFQRLFSLRVIMASGLPAVMGDPSSKVLLWNVIVFVGLLNYIRNFSVCRFTFNREKLFG